MTVEVPNKTYKGIVTEINPTTIIIDTKTFYLPPPIRETVTGLKLAVMETVKVVHNKNGDVIDIERAKPPVAPMIDAEKQQKLHMQEKPTGTASDVKGAATSTPAGNAPPPSDLHIQQQIPVKEWISERERHETILWQSVLARSVEIMNNIYVCSPELSFLGTANVENVVDAHCNNVEIVAERLYQFVKVKVKENEPAKGK